VRLQFWKRYDPAADWNRLDTLTRMVVQDRAVRHGYAMGMHHAADLMDELAGKVACASSMAWLDGRLEADETDDQDVLDDRAAEALRVGDEAAAVLTESAVAVRRTAEHIASEGVGIGVGYIRFTTRHLGLDEDVALGMIGDQPSLGEFQHLPLSDADAMSDIFTRLFVGASAAPLVPALPDREES
jgi:hypothetical protein